MALLYSQVSPNVVKDELSKLESRFKTANPHQKPRTVKFIGRNGASKHSTTVKLDPIQRESAFDKEEIFQARKFILKDELTELQKAVLHYRGNYRGQERENDKTRKLHEMMQRERKNLWVKHGEVRCCFHHRECRITVNLLLFFRVASHLI